VNQMKGLPECLKTMLKGALRASQMSGATLNSGNQRPLSNESKLSIPHPNVCFGYRIKHIRAATQCEVIRVKKKVYDQFLSTPNYKKWIEKDMFDAICKELMLDDTVSNRQK
jgi:hypothetical protein